MTDQFDYFGDNWLEFSDQSINGKKVNEARKDFQSLIGNYNLAGKSFWIWLRAGIEFADSNRDGASTVVAIETKSATKR